MTRKTFERGEAVEFRGGWRGSPWRPGTYSSANVDMHIVIDNADVEHHVPSLRIRKRSK